MDQGIEQLQANSVKHDPFDSKPMSQVLKEQKEATDKILESTKVIQ